VRSLWPRALAVQGPWRISAAALIAAAGGASLAASWQRWINPFVDSGREMDVPMPVTAATREVLQGHFGAAMLQKNPEEYLSKDFAALAETMALAAGMKLESENKNVPTGLES